MQTVSLQPTPSQEFTIQLDGQQYDITIRSVADGSVYADIAINSVTIINSQPCYNNIPIIPYRYLEGTGGQFMFITASGNDPDYENFGGDDLLWYITAAEVASLRGAS